MSTQHYLILDVLLSTVIIASWMNYGSNVRMILSSPTCGFWHTFIGTEHWKSRNGELLLVTTEGLILCLRASHFISFGSSTVHTSSHWARIKHGLDSNRWVGIYLNLIQSVRIEFHLGCSSFKDKHKSRIASNSNPLCVNIEGIGCHF